MAWPYCRRRRTPSTPPARTPPATDSPRPPCRVPRPCYPSRGRRASAGRGLIRLRDPLRRIGRGRPLAPLRDLPVMQPRDAPRPDVGVRAAVGLVAQRLLQGHEAIAARPHHRGQLRETIGVEGVRMEQEDLRDLAP